MTVVIITSNWEPPQYSTLCHFSYFSFGDESEDTETCSAYASAFDEFLTATEAIDNLGCQYGLLWFSAVGNDDVISTVELSLRPDGSVGKSVAHLTKKLETTHSS